MKRRFIKSVTRQFNVETIKAWYIGETRYLKSMLFTPYNKFEGFNNTIYICKDGMVTFYYDSGEIKKFESALEELLDEETFGDICTNYMLLVDEIPNCKTNEAKLELFSKMTPALTIFDEVDENPDWFEEKYRGDCQRRLMRVRAQTHEKADDLLVGVGSNEPKDWIYYGGKLYTK